MIPKLLTIENFGPFKYKQIIDFTKFAQDLFVVNGPTGAGKTTIFEAILVALYGPDAVKRGNAKELVHTGEKTAKIDLIFEHHDKNYQVKRQIGTSKAELILPDKTIITKNVNEEITEIIGMTAKQFKTLAFLPQGEFQQFLLSGDNEKQEILRKIFDTNLIQKFIQKIKVKYDKQRSKLNDIERELKQYLQEYNDVEALEFDLESVGKELKELSKKQQKIQQKVSNQKQINEKFLHLKELEEQVQKLTKELTKKEQEYQNINRKYHNLANNEAELASIEEKIRLKEQKQKLIVEIINILKIEEDLKLTIANNEQELAKLELEIKEFENFAKVYEVKKEQNTKKAQELEVLEVNFKQGKSLKKQLKKLKATERELAVQVVNLNKQKEEQEAKNIELYQLQMNNFAYTLAQKLEVDMPCPVCGSLSHPKIASLNSQHGVTEEEIEQARQQLQKLNQNLKVVEIKQAQLSKEIEYLNKALIDLNLTTTDKFYKLEQKINVLKQEQQEWLVLNKNYQKQVSKNKINQTKLVELQESLQELKTDLIIQQNQKIERFQSLEIKHNIPDKELVEQSTKLKQELSDYQQTQQNLKLYIKEIRNNYNELSQVKAQLEGRLLENREQIKNLQVDLKNKEYLDLAKFEQELQTLNENITEQQVNVQDLQKRQEKIVTIQKMQTQELKRYADLKVLFESSTNNKTNFEKFVQIYHLDQVILKANRRLQLMTNGRYELTRIVDNRLELGVEDYYEGAKRKVKSLSGGEQFKASLALALGLADMVGEQLTLMKLEMIFIDEGFGTLDSESLEQVLDVLLELKEQGYMVGLISHVDLLKERIPNQIKVISQQGQSKIEILN